MEELKWKSDLPWSVTSQCIILAIVELRFPYFNA